MVANIYIKGQIGNIYDENNNIISKGVEVIDVVEQLSQFENPEQINVHINSEGGVVEVGYQIAELISTLPNCYTIAENLCASIATVIHLAVPLSNRKVKKGVSYMIHNPLYMGVSGDADKLKQYSDDIKKVENEIENIYSKATGLSKEALSSLMAVETYLTDEQTVKMKFASEIINGDRKAVAFIINNQNQNMKKSFSERLALAMAVLTGAEEPTNERNAVAMEIPTDKGVLLNDYEDLVVGDAVTLNGEVAPDGEYLAENGQTIVVVDGMVAEIKEAVAVVEENEELATLKAENESLKAENEALNVQVTELSTVSESALAKLEELAQKGSNFTPPAQAVAFRKVEKKEVETYEERKQRLYNK